MRKKVMVLAAAITVAASVATTVLYARSGSTPISPSLVASGSSLTADGIAGGAEEYRRPTMDDLPILLEQDAAKELYVKLMECFPEATVEFFDLFEKAPCYEALVNAAATEVDPSDLLNAVKAMVATRPEVLSACHNGGHSAASILTERLWSSDGSYGEQLAQMRYIMDVADDVCQNGYVHGFYDAIGEGSPTDASFRAAGQVCYEMARFALDCGHGLGHTAWNATKDFTKAAEICGLFEAPYRYSCDDGVIMYVPDIPYKGKTTWNYDARSDDFDPETYYRDAVEVCSWWPKERAGDPEPLKGCWIGVVSGLIWRPISELTKHESYEQYIDTAKELHVYAEAACMQFPPEGEEYCIHQWPGMVIYMTANDPTRVPDFCSSLRKYADRCVKDALEQMRANAAHDTEMSRR